jgi:twitching motility protein PilT
MYTNGAVDTINRLIDVFPVEQRKHVRQQLSQVLIGIVSQRLMSRASGKGRAAAFEVMINNPEISHLICQGKDEEIEALMQTRDQGMQTMKQAADDLVKQNIVKIEEHLLKTGACS